MFRVPVDGDNPTFDDTFKVGLGKWLTSSAAERKEWARRRNAAARLARTNQLARLGAPTDENAFGKFVLGPGSIVAAFNQASVRCHRHRRRATAGKLRKGYGRRRARWPALAAVNAAGRIGKRLITGPGSSGLPRCRRTRSTRRWRSPSGSTQQHGGHNTSQGGARG